MDRLSYAIVTPVRDEASNLPRLARCLFEQVRPPSAWRIVDNGSTDGTLAAAVRFERGHAWIEAVRVPGERVPRRGGPVVRAIRAGIARLDPVPDIVVKVDADVSMAPDYFERLIAEFAADPRLGIASGSRHEWDGSAWRQRHVTGTSVEGQCRAYRWNCLVDVSPLEERLGWDGLDEIKANVLGWRTRTVRSLPFRHHRRIGERDPSSVAAWRAQGDANHYMGYRPSYAVLRALLHARRDPAALALIWGYVGAAMRHEPRCADPTIRAYVRRQQALRQLPARAREALGRS